MRTPKRKKPPGRAASFETVYFFRHRQPTAFHSPAQALAVRDRLLSIAERTLADPDATRPELSGMRVALHEILRELPPDQSYGTVMMLQKLFGRRARMDLLAETALLIERGRA